MMLVAIKVLLNLIIRIGSLSIKSIGKDTNGPFSFPNERWMKNHMANEHRMKAVKEGGLLKVS